MVLVAAILMVLVASIAGAISGDSSGLGSGSSSSGMSSASLGDYNVYTESSKSAPVINDLETLKKAFKGGYSSNSKLLAEAQTFLDMQNTYKVNAIFCAAVSIKETSAGTNGSYAIDGHNWFNYMPITGISSLDGYLGTQSSWCKWDTDAHGIMGFGYYISKHTSCYFSQGEYTVSEIGSHYCDPPDNWIKEVNDSMTQLYSAAGITISVADATSLEDTDYKGTYQSQSGYTFVEYYQNGASWSNDVLNGGSSSSVRLGDSGCHVTSMAIALTGLTGKLITPRDVNNAFNFMINADSAILKTSEFSSLSNLLTIGSYQSNPTSNWLISQLNSGNVLIVHYKGSCEWTKGEHFMVALDYKKDSGKDYIYISNPNRYGPSGWVEISRVTISQLISALPICEK